MRSLFLKSAFQNIAVLTLVVTPLSQNWVKKAQTCISFTNRDKKMRVNGKGKLEVRYSLLKPLSQNFEVLTSRVNVINPKMSQLGPNWYFMYQC